MAYFKRLPFARVISAETTGAQHIPYTVPVADGIVATQQGRYVSTIRLAGLSFETLDDSTINDAHAKLNDALCNMAAPGVTLWQHVVHREVVMPQTDPCPEGFARDVQVEYQRTMDGRVLFGNEFYFSIVLDPTPGMLARWAGKIDRASAKRAAAITERAVADLQRITRDAMAALWQYGPVRLGYYEHDGAMYSAQAELFGYLVNGFEQREPLRWDEFRNGLQKVRTIFGTEAVEIRGAAPSMSHLAAALAFTRLPKRDTYPGILNGLLALPFKFTVSMSFEFIETRAALAMMQRSVGQFENANDPEMRRQKKALEDGMEDLMAGKFVMGWSHMGVLVYGKTVAELDEHVAAAYRIMVNTTGEVIREDLTLMGEYYAQLPGNMDRRPSPEPIKSLNFIGFGANHGYAAGITANRWGRPILYFETAAGGLYGFGFHPQGSTADRTPGAGLVTGMTGAGKSVLQMAIVAALQGKQARGVIFEKGRSSEAAILAMGGSYLAIRAGEPSGVNPFALPPTPENVEHVQEIVHWCASRAGDRLTVAQEQQLVEAVERVFAMDHEDRRMGRLMSVLPKGDPDSVGARLRPWVRERLADGSERVGRYAWLFDNDADLLRFDGHLAGFDLGEVLEKPNIANGLMLHLFHRVTGALDGGPYFMWVDEADVALSHEKFELRMASANRRWRKENGVMIAATQSPHTFASSGIADALINQAVWMIGLADPEAQWTDYERMGYTRREFEIVKSLPLNSRKFLVKRKDTGQSALCKLDLSAMPDTLAVLSGGGAATRALERARERSGGDPVRLVRAFHEERSAA